MTELEPLASALRRELGSPPEAWLSAQRARLRSVLREPPPPRARRVLVPALAAACLALAALVLWIALPSSPRAGVERWLVAEELAGPLKLDDGSSIALRAGSRGRLTTGDTAVRFDLHSGKATFDVVPGRKRAWTITAGRNVVHVLGTRFSVSYGEAEAFEVEVERGTVSVQVAERGSSIRLEAGDRLESQPGRVALVHGHDAASPGAPPSPAAAPPPEETASAEALPAASNAANVPVVPSASRPEAAKSDWQALYREGKYAAALALARKDGLDARLGDLSPATLAELADVARLGGDPDLAVRALTTLLRRFPSAPQARDGQFLLGRVHALRGDTGAAIASFESYLGTGATLYANEAIGRLMELYSARGDTERARAMARRYLERAPSGPYQRLARSLTESK